MSNPALSKQVYLYSLDTSDFYNEVETVVSEKIYKSVAIAKRRKERKQIGLLENDIGISKNSKKMAIIDSQLKKINSIVKELKEELSKLLINNTKIREVKKEKLVSNKAVSLFDSTVTRKFQCKTGELTEDMFIVRVFHYPVMKSILENGFLYNGEKYEYFTSSAGQIRKKKLIAVKSSMWNKHSKAITCDLSVDEINRKGGINANKYQAYLALSNSASMLWKRFNIDRCIVVDDYSTVIDDWVDFIDRDTYSITRKKHDTEIEHMDGCGIMLPSVSKKSFMFRLPWFKGLLSAFDFNLFAKENGNTKVTDIYGKEWDVVEDRINIIFTKSQFKLWKYYDSWEDYKSKFKKNKCEAVKLNVESIGADANLNYQMLQTLTTMTNDELNKIAHNTIQDILKIGSDKETMLRVLGATKENTNKNAFQKSILHYPELLNDSHARQTIKDKKKSLIRDAKAGKLRINGKYTYIIPDLFAFCEWLFLGSKTPEGLIKDGEVSCKLFENEEIDVLRSPHLYKEHAIRKNTHTKLTEKWFISDGVYVSSHDLISKILQFDNDGDNALVTNDKTLIKVAKREMEDIVPLMYDMEKAPPSILNNEVTYKSLTSAYKANIGIISNDITKIWNAQNPPLHVIKWLCMCNNFTIDYAKTLFMPEPPKEVEEEIKQYTKNKLPYFFIHAKAKEEHQVEEINNSTVNKLEYMIPNKRINFKKVAGGGVDYYNLINHRTSQEVNMDVVDRFIALERSKHVWFKDLEKGNENAYNDYVRDELHKVCSDTEEVVNSLVINFYRKDSAYKNGLWNSYGEEIYKNLMSNIGDTIQCENCNERVRVEQDNEKYCESCKVEVKRIQNRVADKKYREKLKR